MFCTFFQLDTFRSLASILPVEEFGDVDLCLCRGFLIDGDHAIQRREGEMASSDRVALCFMLFGSHYYYRSVRQGTLPFMSFHLLNALHDDEPVLHTPVDDLESFLWVLVWSLAYILDSMKEDPKIKRILTALSSLYIPDILLREHRVKNWPDRVFRNLILEWLEIVRNSRREIEQILLRSSDEDDDIDAQEERNLDDIEDCSRRTYKQFFQAGYRHLRDIRDFEN